MIMNALNGVYRALARKEKNSMFCMNWEIKQNWGSWGGTMSLSVGSVAD